MKRKLATLAIALGMIACGGSSPSDTDRAPAACDVPSRGPIPPFDFEYSDAGACSCHALVVGNVADGTCVFSDGN
jgi:hypothetical protein